MNVMKIQEYASMAGVTTLLDLILAHVFLVLSNHPTAPSAVIWTNALIQECVITADA